MSARALPRGLRAPVHGLLAAWLACGAAHAETVYVSTGKNGRMVFSNQSPDAQTARRVDTWSPGMAVTRGVQTASYVPVSMQAFPGWRLPIPALEAPAVPRTRAVRRAHHAEFERLASEIAARHGVDEHLVQAVIEVESGFNPSAVSSAGAGGLMQLMPGTARRFGVQSRFDPGDNIEGGVRYLRLLLQLFGGNVRLALAGYNAGEGAVMKNGWRIPPYSETQKYVPAVLAAWERRRNAQAVTTVAESGRR